MSQDLKDLLARIEGAAGADRRLDYEIFATFAAPGEANAWDPAEGHRYTSSVKDAISLAKRFSLHGYTPQCEDRLPGEARIQTWVSGADGVVRDGPSHEARAATAALAILVVLLRYLLASHPPVTRQGEPDAG